jgi:hypothetical protein
LTSLIFSTPMGTARFVLKSRWCYFLTLYPLSCPVRGDVSW